MAQQLEVAISFRFPEGLKERLQKVADIESKRTGSSTVASVVRETLIKKCDDVLGKDQ